ncbi:MAG: hypothetical protein WKF84_25255 [Pyrinomonadaceae bacterium]
MRRENHPDYRRERYQEPSNYHPDYEGRGAAREYYGERDYRGEEIGTQAPLLRIYRRENAGSSCYIALSLEVPRHYDARCNSGDARNHA